MKYTYKPTMRDKDRVAGIFCDLITIFQPTL